MRVGIYGGTFSPVHNGHIAAAKAFMEQMWLDILYIIPTGVTPHKVMKGDASARDRLEMCRLAFADVEGDINLIGFTNCGGCPGKKAALRARELVNRGVDTIAFASCIKKGMPINFPCPHAEKMMELVKKEVGDRIKILEYTH